jgi:hypothetical protein
MGREIPCVEATPTRPRSSSNNCRDLGVKQQSLSRAWSFRRTAAPAGRWLYLGTNCLARRFTSSVVKTRPGENEFFMRALDCFERIFYPKTTRPELFGEWGSGGSLVRPWRPQSALGVRAEDWAHPAETSTKSARTELVPQSMPRVCRPIRIRLNLCKKTRVLRRRFPRGHDGDHADLLSDEAVDPHPYSTLPSPCVLHLT